MRLKYVSPIDRMEESLVMSGKFLQVANLESDEDNKYGGRTIKAVTHKTETPTSTNMIFKYHFDKEGRLRVVESTNYVKDVSYVHRTVTPLKWYQKVADVLFPF